MKKYIIVLGLLLFSFTSQSQVLISLLLGDKLNSDKMEFGLEGGINYSAITGMESSNRMGAFNLGFYFDMKVKNQWNFYTGVLVKSDMGLDKLTEKDLAFLGTDVYPEKGDYKQVINSFIVPALANYKFKNHFYVEAGPQFALITDSYVQFNSKEDGKTMRIREKNKDNTNRIDAGVAGGFGYKFRQGKGISIGLKYYHGFVDVYKNRPGTKNSSIFLKANIRIKATKKAIE